MNQPVEDHPAAAASLPSGPGLLPLRRDQLAFPAQLTIWSWRVMGHAWPRLGRVAPRVSRAYTIIGAPAAFPAMHALVCMTATNPARREVHHCPACLVISGIEHGFLNAIRHLQRGNEALGRRAISRVVDSFHLDLALHYARLYACEMAAAGQPIAGRIQATGRVS